MLNIIWPAFIVISCIYAILTGRVSELNNLFFYSFTQALNLSIIFFGKFFFWNVILEFLKKTTLMEKLTKLLNPGIALLFPELKNHQQAKAEISMNLIANILGLGNAATPLGLKAMKTMQKENKKKNIISNSMAMFIVLNTASLQLIPTNVIAIRTSLSSNNATQIVFPVWIVTIIAATVGVIATKIILKKVKY